jgi:perosamine synthetase
LTDGSIKQRLNPGEQYIMHIPLFRPIIREEAIEAVCEVLRSGWLGLGPRTALFEEAFAGYINVPYCVGLNSGTSALHLGLHLLDLPPGSEVITTPLTFVSTNHAILYEKCQPVFADIQLHTGNLDPASVSKHITERTKAIMLVHYGGYPCDLDEFYALARDRNIPIIEDCAHACGATYKGQRIGSHGDIHAFSFHAVKNLPMGDGGALACRSLDYYERLRRLRWVGISSETFERTLHQRYRWQYDVVEVGFKYHMNDVQAAMGLAQLPYVDEDNSRRAEIAAQYREQLSSVSGLQLLKYETDRTSSYHLFCVLAENRDALVDKFQAHHVDVGVHYMRNDRYPMYEEQELPNVEYFSRRVISLPMHLALTEEQITHVTDIIKEGW